MHKKLEDSKEKSQNTAKFVTLKSIDASAALRRQKLAADGNIRSVDTNEKNILQINT